MSRLDLNKTIQNVIVDMSEGNPGGLTVLMQIYQNTKSIDPDCLLDWMGPFANLDNMECYGHKIWMLYKDICNQNLSKMIAVLRATQLGLTSPSAVIDAIDGRLSLDVDDLTKQVQELLPNFKVN